MCVCECVCLVLYLYLDFCMRVCVCVTRLRAKMQVLSLVFCVRKQQIAEWADFGEAQLKKNNQKKPQRS